MTEHENTLMEDTIDREKKSQPTRVLIISLLVLMVVLFFVSREMETVKDFIRNSGWVGMLVSVGLYGVLGASVIPSEPLTVLIATIYGPFTATLVAGTGNLLAAVIEYYLGAQLGDVASFAERKAKLPLGLGKLPIDSPAFLIAARMIPGYGPKLVSVLSGIYRVPVWMYVWTAAIPTYLGAAIFAYGGFGLFTLIKPK
jgi:uncharacterized membrane protein YdjX (TVP38/TMEM64 family)